MAVVLAILQTATAAAVWPLVTLPVAIVSVVITALRVITWHHPQARHFSPHNTTTGLLLPPAPSCSTMAESANTLEPLDLPAEEQSAYLYAHTGDLIALYEFDAEDYLHPWQSTHHILCTRS